MTNVTPVILAGGQGTRLWPLSRKGMPKQFARVFGGRTLFQTALERAHGAQFAAPIIVTASDYRFVATEQAMSIGIDPGAVLLEPCGKNTAPAILAASLQAVESDEDAVLLVLPSDHLIEDVEAFHKAVETALGEARLGRLVTFGIVPERAETGFGYLELERATKAGEAFALSAFVEKPSEARAQAMVDAGNFLWNAGIFLFRAQDMVAAFETLAPQMLELVKEALAEARADLGFLRLAEAPWDAIEGESIDYAIMEKADALSVVPLDAGWSDLGSWAAIHGKMEQDESGVARSENVTAINCSNTLLRVEDNDLELVGIGLKDLCVVAMNDAVLVADRAQDQDVKLAIETLKAKGAKQAERFAKDHRPWGHFETLALSERFQVKRIVVKPGAALSLQSHHHRSEHWVVVHGTAKVTLEDEVKLVSENESIYIPLGAKHRMENPGKLPMVLIEVQTGSYLGEDDIIRYEDIYARRAEGKL